MSPKKDKKESASIVKDVESQIEEFITQKKGEIEKGLDEKIKDAKEEAKKQIGDIEKEFEKEKESLINYQNVMADFEAKKKDLEGQIKEHLNKAVEVQKEIERLTGSTLDELKKVDEFNQKLEELHKDVAEKAGLLKKDLEEKFGIVAEVLEGYEHEQVIGDLEQELTKLKKIKELLGEKGAEDSETEAEEPEKIPDKEAQFIEEERKQYDRGVEDVRKEMEKMIDQLEESEAEQKKPSTEEAPPEEMPYEEMPPEEVQEKVNQESEIVMKDALSVREKYRKSESSEEEGEVSYFQKDDNIILDGENIISRLTESIEEIKKLYFKMQEDESPKHQFIVKQEIIKQQELLRKNMLKYSEMCNRDKCSLPEYTMKILSPGTLNDIIEKASMMNWSEQGDFNAFVEYVEDLKNNYYACITPVEGYLNSIAEALGVK